MAKILILSDLHANLPALDAVLSAEQDYDVLLCAGDLVGYYDSPNEVCARIREIEQEKYVIRGNHDAYVTGCMLPDPKNIEAYRSDWTASELLPNTMAWLASLLPTVHAVIDGWSFTLRHANPWDEERYIYPDSHELLCEINLRRREVLVLGHTHYPLIKPCGDGILINPGSVGQPRDRDPRASYAIFDTVSGETILKRTVYDVETYQDKLIKAGWPHGMIKILSRTDA